MISLTSCWGPFPSWAVTPPSICPPQPRGDLHPRGLQSLPGVFICMCKGKGPRERSVPTHRKRGRRWWPFRQTQHGFLQ